MNYIIYNNIVNNLIYTKITYIIKKEFFFIVYLIYKAFIIKLNILNSF